MEKAIEDPPPETRIYRFFASVLNIPSGYRYGSLMEPLEDEIDPEDCADGGESIRNALTIGFSGEGKASPDEPIYEWKRAPRRQETPGERGGYGARDPEEVPQENVDILKFSRFVLTNWC